MIAYGFHFEMAEENQYWSLEQKIFTTDPTAQ